MPFADEVLGAGDPFGALCDGVGIVNHFAQGGLNIALQAQ